MAIVLKTNLDRYNGGKFPNLEEVPRVGEMVRVSNHLIPYFEKHKLPIELEVVKVIHVTGGVICELWYNQQDRLIASNAGAELF